MTAWLDALLTLGDRGEACVIVTVAQVHGSAPRDAGTRMLVTAQEVIGTIGGGHLEFKAMELAHALLNDPQAAASQLHRFALGPSLGQCCGGVVLLHLERVGREPPGWLAQLRLIGEQRQDCVLISEAGRPGGGTEKLIVTADRCYGRLPGYRLSEEDQLLAQKMLHSSQNAPQTVLKPLGAEVRKPSEGLLFECVRQNDFQVILFGAGHVGRALVHILGELTCQVTWVDTREQPFPARVPANVHVVESDDPVYEVRQAPPGAYYLVLTHSHALDYDLCEAILARQDARFFGLIGSKTKRNQFERRLLQKGFTPAALQTMTCPIGVPGIKDKHPAAIAVAVVAQVLQVHEQASQAARPAAGAQVTSL